MAWPTDTITTTHLDASTDDPSQARAELKTVADKVKEVIAGRATASGVCDLDSGTKIPSARLSESILTTALGYAVCQRGTGTGQSSTAVVKLGKDSSLAKLKCTIDSTDYGNVALESYCAPITRTRRNLLMNGCFRVAQRVATGGVDWAYGRFDRWKCLANGTQAMTDTATAEDGSTNALGLGHNAGSPVKFGILQILETKDAKSLQGKTVTFSVRLKASGANIDDIRMVVLSWTGTGDAPTHPVSAWGASGANPTWATSWTAENTPADKNITTSWATYSVTAAIDTASVNNVAVLIFSNSTTPTSSDRVYIDNAQLEVGSEVTDFELRSYAEELALCQRYFNKHYSTGSITGFLSSTSGNIRRWAIPYPVVMRTTPVVSVTLDSGSFTEITSPSAAMLSGYWTASDTTTTRHLTAYTADAEI